MKEEFIQIHEITGDCSEDTYLIECPPTMNIIFIGESTCVDLDNCVICPLRKIKMVCEEEDNFKVRLTPRILRCILEYPLVQQEGSAREYICSKVEGEGIL